ncbi:MAG: hypothetical protein OEV43_10080 [Coriobacteriia bacterium]|nr:hypothetical protein [Coriobacteriia bacterium]
MSFETLFSSISEVVTEPTSNLTAAVLLVAMLVLVVLMIVVALLLLLTPGRRPKPSQPDIAGEQSATLLPPVELTAEERERLEARSKRRRLTSWIVVAILVLAALVSGYILTSTQSFCAESCHAETDVVFSNVGDAHAGVRCVDCHEDPPAFGVLGALSARTRYVITSVTGGAPEGPASVGSSRCVRCHESIETETFEDLDRGVKVSHLEILAAGMSCQDCHPRVGHLAEETRRPGMSACLRCHDGDEASSDCAVCHIGDAARARTTTRVFGKVDLPVPRDCGGCHSQKPCDVCHGLRLPHSLEFLEMGHAREAAFEKKELCLRCHESNECADCHLWPMDQHVDGWKELHKNYSFDSRCTCHQNGPLLGKAFCPVCH